MGLEPCPPLARIVPGQQSAEHVTQIYGFDPLGLAPSFLRAVHRSNIKPVLCKPEKVFWQVCSRFPLEHLWHVWLLLFDNLVLSPLFVALHALGLGWQGGFSVASGAQASLFGLLSYFSLSTVILLPFDFRVHGWSGGYPLGWPLPRLWFYDDGVTVIARWCSPPVNYRYTVVLQSKLREWPPPVTRATPPMDPEVKREGKNSRLRERRQQAKERGLCTRCYREPAMPNMALCEQCCNKTREYRAGKKQKPNGPRVLESKPIPLPLSIEGTEPVTFPLFDQLDRQEHGDWASSTEPKPNRPRVQESKLNALPQNEEGREQGAFPFYHQPDRLQCDYGSWASGKPE